MQDHFRAMKRHPSEANRTEVDTDRAQLRVQLDHFSMLGAQLGRQATTFETEANDPSIALFDHLDIPPDDNDDPDDADVADPNVDNDPDPTPPDILPEAISLTLPSRTPGATDFVLLELQMRDTQIQTYLQKLRDIIAEKSFLYSHVIRVAPRKVVRTRARTNIAKLNLSISHLARAYTKARLAMLRLGSNEDKYPIMLPEHVRASTAILDPNEPGSTSLHLSWIWQMPGQRMDHSETERECKSSFSQ